MSSRVRPFQPAAINLRIKEPDERNVRTIPQLIEYNGHHNPQYTFCVQAHKQQRSVYVSYHQLKQAILQCSDWLQANIRELELPHRDAHGELCKGPPIALSMGSDIGLLVYLLSFLSLGVPVLLLSARLSPSAISHLIFKTSARAIICAPNHKSTVQEAIAAVPAEQLPPAIYQQESFEAFFDCDQVDTSRSICHPHHYLRDSDRDVLILHSSGSTGLPKPIYSSHRYLLAFAACHDFDEPREAQIFNVSTLPLFHGYGLVAPCLSLGIGMTLVLPASSSVPTGSSIVGLLNESRSKSLMTVPSILEDVASMEGSEAIETLTRLKFVAFGGGLLKKSVGHKLSLAGVKLLNHYGATEIGPIALVFLPPKDYDYQYFRMRKDMNLDVTELPAPADGRPRYLVTALPFGWSEKMVIQDELVSNPQHPNSDFSAIGRNDDMIILATGEKVIPHVLESNLSESEAIKGAIAFGNGQFELGVLIEPRNPVESNNHAAFVSSMWPLIERINTKMDGHARVSDQAAVVILSPHQSLPRSDKGSIMRKEVYSMFDKEIAQAYQALEDSALNETIFAIDADNLEKDLKSLVHNHLSWKLHPDEWGADDDLFELGLDSLQAVKLRRLLFSSTIVTSSNKSCLTRDFVYRHPTLSNIAKALRGTTQEDSTGLIQYFVDQYSLQTRRERPVTILLTGSTGNLGTNLLTQLACSPIVSKIICLVRPSSNLDGQERQSQALRARHMTLNVELWHKIEVISTNAAMPHLGLIASKYESIRNEVTHVLHNAWPMDFKMTLPSFKGQFQVLRNLLSLVVDIGRSSTQRPRLMFISSVATVGQWPSIYGHSQVLEIPVNDTKCANAFGYGEAKLVCERMIENARCTHGNAIDVSYIRVGQIAGSSDTGYWNPKEHIPAMIKSSQYIGALPKINGVLSWLPVNSAAETVRDLLLQPSLLELVYHLENPVRQPWHEILSILAPLIEIDGNSNLPLRDWIAKVESDVVTDESSTINPARILADFFSADFERMAGGDVTFDMRNSLKASASLRAVGPISQTLVANYVDCWKSIGFLNK